MKKIYLVSQKPIYFLGTDLVQNSYFILFFRSLVKDVSTLSEVDGYSAWRLKEAVELSDLVQRRIKYLQNPPNCSTAKKLLCTLNKARIIILSI